MLLFFALMACTDDVPQATSPSTADTAIGEGRCAATGNALRFDCALDAPGEVAWWPEGDPDDVRTARGDTVVRIHTLRPDVATVVRFPDASEQRVEPGVLPSSLAGISAQVTGAGTGTLAAVTSPCSSRDLVVIDGQGRPRWYESLERKVLGLDVTPDQTLLAMEGTARIAEWSVQGAPIWAVEPDTTAALHHDLARDAFGFTYALQADVYVIDEVRYVLDGLMVFDPEGTLVTTWELIDHLPPIYEPTNNNGYWTTRFPGAIDFSHGNSVEVAPDGDLVLSLRWLDTVVKIAGDPTSADFGTPRWWLSSYEGVPSDFTFAGDDPVFDGQHHPSLTSDGDLVLFDNRARGTNSRGMRYRLDGDVAEVSQAWPLDHECQVQGSAYPLPGGGVMLTCATRNLVVTFPAASTEPSGSVELSCSTGAGTITARAIPVDW